MHSWYSISHIYRCTHIYIDIAGVAYHIYTDTHIYIADTAYHIYTNAHTHIYSWYSIPHIIQIHTHIYIYISSIA